MVLGDGAIERLRELVRKKVTGSIEEYEERDFQVLWDSASDELKDELLPLLKG